MAAFHPVSTSTSLVMGMPRDEAAAETGREQQQVLTAVHPVASSEAAGFPPRSLFQTSLSLVDTVAKSSQLSPVIQPVQDLPLNPTPSPAEQRTIFVAGFPLDMTEREFHCLLTFLPGYEACQLSWNTGSPQGFALFNSNSEATAAVERLAGHQVVLGTMLRAELAHKNLVIKKDGSSGGPAAPPQFSPVDLQGGADPMLNPALNGVTFNNMFQRPPQQLLAPAGVNGDPSCQAVLGNAYGAPYNWRSQGTARDNAPCNTLFIGNLGEHTREEELQQLMASQPGFRQIKWSPSAKGTIAFVEFDDVTSAVLAHGSLQGFVLPSNDRGGLRIQFSKNPLGKRSPSDVMQGLHGLFAPAHPTSSSASPAPGLFNAALAQPVAGMAPAAVGYLNPMDLPPSAHHMAAATATAMVAAAATQGMIGSNPLFGPMLL